MKNLTILSILILALASCKQNTFNYTKISEKVEETQTQIKPISSFYPKERAQILVVGTFHMNYPGMDNHVTSDDKKIDVLKEPKKSEITELVEYIKKFKPTKIAVEAGHNCNATEKLREYKAGKHRDSRDETYQIAMRIATDLKLDTVYGVDARALSQDLYLKDSVVATSLVSKVDWEREYPLDANMKTWMEYEDDITVTSNLLDYFKHMNSQEYHQYGYGSYLTSWFKDESNQGADQLSMWWYNRNLRIFRNIIGITEGPEDRIMVLMGNGHAAVLRQLIEASPEYDFVEFDSL